MSRLSLKKIIILSGCLALALTFWAGPSWSKGPHPAQKAALHWLSLIDAGDFGESWKQAGTSFQKAIGGPQWVKTLGAVRQPLGKVLTRTPSRLDLRDSLPGAPDGKYALQFFHTGFAHKKSAEEQVTLVHKPNQGWKVVGYFIR
ncbi:MAG: DUF4019 domain-containing protein [Desulfarculaceae bacterium]|jgi:hypothetical protein